MNIFKLEIIKLWHICEWINVKIGIFTLIMNMPINIYTEFVELNTFIIENEVYLQSQIYLTWISYDVYLEKKFVYNYLKFRIKLPIWKSIFILKTEFIFIFFFFKLPLSVQNLKSSLLFLITNWTPNIKILKSKPAQISKTILALFW